MKDVRSLNPTRGKITKLLDQCDNKVHIIDMASNLDKRAVSVYVTEGENLTLLNGDMVKAGLLNVEDFITDRDYFPDQFIPKINNAITKYLGIHATFEIHTAAICPNAVQNKTTGQE